MPLYRGSGGGVWEITPPEPGTARRRHFDAQLESGELILVEDDDPQAATPQRKRAPKKSAAQQVGG